MVDACHRSQESNSYLGCEEVFVPLRKIDDAGRVSVLRELIRIMRLPDAWRGFGKRFVEQGWPKEKVCQSDDTVFAMVQLCFVCGEDFEDVFETVKWYLHPVARPLVPSSSAHTAGSGDMFAVRSPETLLKLLDLVIPENPDGPVYELLGTIGRIAESNPELRNDPRWKRLYALA
jgi:hypothetical protein